MALVRLPNGDWVDPDYVRMVELLPRVPSILGDRRWIPPRVIVHHGTLADPSTGRLVIVCENIEEAVRVREEIAKALNG